MAKVNSARRRSRQVISKVAGTYGLDISAPDLVAKLLKDHWKTFYSDKVIAKDLLGIALSDLVRDVIAREVGLQNQDDDGPQMLLDFWPVGERRLAADIGIMRAFVPSREAHVALYDATKITPTEIEEAGHYLIGQGRGCINRGNGLLLLAKRRRSARDETGSTITPRPPSTPPTPGPSPPP